MKYVKGQTQRIKEQNEDKGYESRLMKWKGIEKENRIEEKKTHTKAAKERREEKKKRLNLIRLLLLHYY